MINHLRVLAIMAWVFTQNILVAQPPALPNPESSKPTPPPRDTKDPTIPNERIRELLNASKANKPAATPKLPTIHLKGRIVSKRRPAAALLEVEGQAFTVTKGAAIVAGPNLILKVLEVTNNEVRLEIDPIKQVIVLQ